MNIHIQNSPIQDSSLHGWALASTIATIFSSFAVVVYIIQLIVTTRLINRQLIQNQEQFRSLNQGYIILEYIIIPTSSLEDLHFNGFSIIGKVTNAGNFPVSAIIEALQLEIAHPQVRARIAEQQMVVVIYPKQISELKLLNNYSFPDGTPRTLEQIAELDIKITVVLRYSDINTDHVKRINREFLIKQERDNLISIYTAINDEV